MNRAALSTGVPQRRRGLTTPLVAAALLVAMCGLALILDRLWIDAAQLELVTAAEGSALAGARELASDRRLLPGVRPAELVDSALQAALSTALENRVAGQAASVQERDVLFIDDADQVANDSESSVAPAPNSDQPRLPVECVVHAHRARFRGNPLALFISDLTRQPFTDLSEKAAARINARVLGLRPLPGSVSPAIPLGIWHKDPMGQSNETWEVAITQRKGRDDFSVDAATHTVHSGADGLTELTLRLGWKKPLQRPGNARLLDLGSDFQDDLLQRQWRVGIDARDLALWDGELQIPGEATAGSSAGLSLRALAVLEESDIGTLEQIKGQPRIAILYGAGSSQGTPVATGRVGKSNIDNVSAVRLVAVRVMDVFEGASGEVHVVIQPTVVASRTLLADETTVDRALTNDMSSPPEDPSYPEPLTTTGSAAQDDPSRTTYVYRLELTQ